MERDYVIVTLCISTAGQSRHVQVWPPKVPPPVEESGHHLLQGSLGPGVHIPSGISIGSAVLAQRMVVTN